MTDRSPENDPEDVQHTGPTIRDKRRIDPVTGQVREPQETAAPAAPADQVPTDAEVGQPAGTAPASPAETAEIDQLKAQLADRLSDLQRVQAEYVNYKRRVDRDRDLARSGGVESVLRDLLGVLDTVRSAREHEELSPGFKAVADELDRLAGKHGLASFGEAGDLFDPRIHEALMHASGEGLDLQGPTCVTILQPGYKIGDRVVRPARVAVAEPSEPVTVPASEPAASED